MCAVHVASRRCPRAHVERWPRPERPPRTSDSAPRWLPLASWRSCSSVRSRRKSLWRTNIARKPSGSSNRGAGASTPRAGTMPERVIGTSVREKGPIARQGAESRQGPLSAAQNPQPVRLELGAGFGEQQVVETLVGPGPGGAMARPLQVEGGHRRSPQRAAGASLGCVVARWPARLASWTPLDRDPQRVENSGHHRVETSGSY